MTQKQARIEENWSKILNLELENFGAKIGAMEIQNFHQFKLILSKINRLKSVLLTVDGKNYKDLSRFGEIEVNLIKTQTRRCKKFDAKNSAWCSIFEFKFWSNKPQLKVISPTKNSEKDRSKKKNKNQRKIGTKRRSRMDLLPNSCGTSKRHLMKNILLRRRNRTRIQSRINAKPQEKDWI